MRQTMPEDSILRGLGDDAAMASPRTRVELFHSTLSNFDEKTYFLMALSLSAHRCCLPGQSIEKLTYVVRPMRIASHASSWPNPSRK